jgi:hypothetical protein
LIGLLFTFRLQTLLLATFPSFLGEFAICKCSTTKIRRFPIYTGVCLSELIEYLIRCGFSDLLLSVVQFNPIPLVDQVLIRKFIGSPFEKLDAMLLASSPLKIPSLICLVHSKTAICPCL